MDSLHLHFVKCSISNSGSHQGLCFSVAFLKAVSSVCVLQWVTYFFRQTVFTFFPQFTILIIMFNLFSLSFNILIMRNVVHVWHSMFTHVILDDILKCKKEEYCTRWWIYSPPLVWKKLKVGKIEGSTLWRVNYNVSL